MAANGYNYSSPAPVGSLEMDPSLWRRLPLELLEHVLSFLPVKSFLPLRTTCKRFRSLLFSPSFVSKHSSHSSSSSPFSSFLLLSHPHFDPLRLPLFDSARCTWRKLSLSLSPLLPRAAPSSLISTSRGLLCFSLPNSSSFLVCNLLASSSRRIEFPTFPFDFELFTLVSAPDGYRIFLISSSVGGFAFVYDSGENSWREFEGFDPILNSDDYHQEGVCLGARLYFTTSHPFAVVSFDLGTGKWERLVANLPSELTFIRLASDGEGKLYMVGGIGSNGISRSMKLWELGEGGREWVEVDGLPEGMCKKFMCVCYHNYEHVYCFWHQGMVCICCYTWPEILYYKSNRKTWHWLPKCPSLPEKWSCGFRWFSFVPDLYSSV